MKLFQLMAAHVALITFCSMQSMGLQFETYVQSFKWSRADELQKYEAKIRERASILLSTNALCGTSHLGNTEDDMFGEVSLLFAASSSDSMHDLVKILLATGFNPGRGSVMRSAFEHAIRSNALKNAELMLESNNADPRVGIFALMDQACLTQTDMLFEGQIKLLTHLLEKLKARKESPDVEDALGRTPLMNIMQIKRPSTIIDVPMRYREAFASLLLDAGAQPLKKDQEGISALDLARKNKFSSLQAMMDPDVVR